MDTTLPMLVLLLACDRTQPIPIAQTDAPAAPGVWAIPVGARPGAEERAWEPLSQIIGPAQIIGFGEAEHGSLGLTELRGAATAWLVEHEGVRLVAQEASWIEALELERDLQACRSGVRPIERPPDTLMWNRGTQPFLDWACAFNASHSEDPLHVIGTDAQSPWHDVKLLRSIASELLDPAPVLSAIDGVSTCQGAAHEDLDAYRAWGKANGFPVPTPQDHQACLAGLAKLDGLLESTGEYLRARGLANRARLASAGLRTFEDQNQSLLVHKDPAAAQEIRDGTQVDLLLTLREELAPGARTVVWAHNNHVRIAGDQVPKSFAGLGTRLARRDGIAYVALGTIGHTVKTSFGARHDPPVPTDPDATALRLRALGEPSLLVSSALWEGANKAAPFGREPSMVVREQFAGLLYIERSDAASEHADP